MASKVAPGRRKWAVRVAAVVTAILVLAAVACWVAGGVLAAPVNHPVGPPPADLEERTTVFNRGAAPSMTGWWVHAPAPRAVVLLLHPLRADRRAMIGRARVLVEENYDVVLIDLQAHGERPGEAIAFGALERDDVVQAVQVIRRRAPGLPMAVVGCSLGGASMLLAGPLGVDAVVLESVYPAIDGAIANRLAMRAGRLGAAAAPLLSWQLPLRLGVSAAELRPIAVVGEVGCPVLVLSGEADRHTTAGETRQLYSAAAEPKRLVLFPGAGHEDLLAFDPAAWKAAVLPFLDGAISGDQANDPPAE